MTGIALKRIYEPAAPGDGARILVDRLWPRGLSKDRAAVDHWLKDVAPSHELRRRFHGKPEDWQAFRAAYARELAAATEPVRELRNFIGTGKVTLLYAARDEAHNNAVALKQWLEGKA